MELASYLSLKITNSAQTNGRRVVAAWESQCKATYKDMSYLVSNQEEADTKLLLHALDATASGATSIRIHSPDTDVFVLALRRYPELCEDTAFVTGVGQRHRVIHLRPIVEALGPNRTAALPGFHALSGADNTGSFAGKGKLACWKTFLDAGPDVITAFTNLGTTETPTETTETAIENFVCQLYLTNTNFTKVKDARWWLFRKKQAQSERLPPTEAALHEAVLRAHYQAMVWNNDKVANPELPSPQSYGWMMEENRWLPVMTKLPPAPDAVIHLVKCGCVKRRCETNQCQCRKAGLNCTDLCSCFDSEEKCENEQQIDFMDDSDDDDDNNDII